MTAYVDIVFKGGISSQFESGFTESAAFWNNVITSGAPTYTVNRAELDLATSQCEYDKVYYRGDTIDGLTIISQVVEIDGVGNILGQAGPCMFNGNYPLFGIMMFDSADSQGLLEAGQFSEVIKHEMGHVIGIGAIWPLLGLVDDPCPLLFGNCDGRRPTYNGVNGYEGFELLGGSGILKVSDENGPGTWNAHWDEDYENEMMTGFLNAGVENPMSIMTVKSLIDIGYTVNEDTAEVYTLPIEFREGLDLNFSALIDLRGDILVFDYEDIADFEASLEEIEAPETYSYKSEFTAIMLLMIAGFSMLSALVLYQSRKQKEMNKKLAGVQQSAVENPMHTIELGASGKERL